MTGRCLSIRRGPIVKWDLLHVWSNHSVSVHTSMGRACVYLSNVLCVVCLIEVRLVAKLWLHRDHGESETCSIESSTVSRQVRTSKEDSVAWRRNRRGCSTQDLHIVTWWCRRLRTVFDPLRVKASRDALASDDGCRWLDVLASDIAICHGISSVMEQ